MSLTAIFRDISPPSRWADHVYSWLRFRQKHRRFPRSDSTGSYCDRLYRMKVDGSLLDPLRQFVSDKEHVKHYVSGTIGKQYNIETIGILVSQSDIDRFELPRFPCVVKPTHLSGEIEFFGESRKSLNKGVLRKWLSANHYMKKREQNYRYLKPKIIVERFFSPDGMIIPMDYKIFCFHGIPGFIQVDRNRFGNHIQNFYDIYWTKIDFTLMTCGSKDYDVKPPSLDIMLDIAAKLSQSFSFMRVDLYGIADEVRVGELTNCPGAADHQFQPLSAERVIGRMFDRGSTIDLSSFTDR